MDPCRSGVGAPVVCRGRWCVSCDLVDPCRSGGGAPVVGEVDGDYSYDAKKHVLNWRLAVIDSSNSQGSMEFTIAGMPDGFFPIQVSFVSTKSYCNIEVSLGGTRAGLGALGRANPTHFQLVASL